MSRVIAGRSNARTSLLCVAEQRGSPRRALSARSSTLSVLSALPALLLIACSGGESTTIGVTDYPLDTPTAAELADTRWRFAGFADALLAPALPGTDFALQFSSAADAISGHDGCADWQARIVIDDAAGTLGIDDYAQGSDACAGAGDVLDERQRIHTRFRGTLQMGGEDGALRIGTLLFEPESGATGSSAFQVAQPPAPGEAKAFSLLRTLPMPSPDICSAGNSSALSAVECVAQANRIGVYDDAVSFDTAYADWLTHYSSEQPDTAPAVDFTIQRVVPVLARDDNTVVRAGQQVVGVFAASGESVVLVGSTDAGRRCEDPYADDGVYAAYSAIPADPVPVRFVDATVSCLRTRDLASSLLGVADDATLAVDAAGAPVSEDFVADHRLAVTVQSDADGWVRLDWTVPPALVDLRTVRVLGTGGMLQSRSSTGVAISHLVPGIDYQFALVPVRADGSLAQATVVAVNTRAPGLSVAPLFRMDTDWMAALSPLAGAAATRCEGDDSLLDGAGNACVRDAFRDGQAFIATRFRLEEYCGTWHGHALVGTSDGRLYMLRAMSHSTGEDLMMRSCIAATPVIVAHECLSPRLGESGLGCDDWPGLVPVLQSTTLRGEVARR